MAIRSLVQLERGEFQDLGVPLRNPSELVVDYGNEFQVLVDDLIQTLYFHKIAVGLAAPQIGVHRRLAVVDLKSEPPMETIVLVNPQIVSTSGKKVRMKESCMSLPHFRGEVERRYKMHVAFQDRFGRARQMEATGFLGRVIAHEVDHLDGILYTDRMERSTDLEPVDFFT